MKYIYTLLYLLALSLNVNAQNYYAVAYYVDFDTNLYLNKIFFDSGATDAHKWQIGTPLKTVFTSAHSGTRAIMTDTTLQCTANDTAVFYAKVPTVDHEGLIEFSYWYQLDIDTGDYALVEVQNDTTGIWNTCRKDTVSFTGWKFVDIHKQSSSGFDTLIYRFTLVTGNSTKPRDGWMIDDFLLGYYGESVDDVNVNNLFAVYPNPVTSTLCISPKQNIYNETSVSLVNMFGQQVCYKIYSSIADKLQIDVSDFLSGIYSCIITTNGKRYTKHIIIAH